MYKATLKLDKVKGILKKQKGKRPILHGINYNEDFITFTDSYVLVQVKNNQRVENSFTIDVVNGSFIDGIYPEVEGIKPNAKDLKQVIDVKVEYKEFTSDKYFYKVNDETHFNKKVVDEVINAIDFGILKYKDLITFNNSNYQNWFLGKSVIVYDNKELNLYIMILKVVIEEK